MKNKKSQQEKILDYLLEGKSITPLEALRYFGCFRLSAIVFNLKQQGYEFTTKLVKNKYGNKFARYSLVEKY